MEFDDLVVNVGVRIDQLDPSETAPERAMSYIFTMFQNMLTQQHGKKLNHTQKYNRVLGFHFLLQIEQMYMDTMVNSLSWLI